MKISLILEPHYKIRLYSKKVSKGAFEFEAFLYKEDAEILEGGKGVQTIYCWTPFP